MASGEGVNEMLIGLLLTAVGFGSVFLGSPIYCCGFAIFGPILFLTGVYKAVRAPSRPPMYYPPPYAAPAYSPPLGAPPSPAAPAPPPAAGSKKCPTCGSENRGDARFCTSCGAPF